MEIGREASGFVAIFVKMEFILPFLPPGPARLLGRREPVLMLGSCFAEEIGNKLAERRFSVVINPHGILYNPHSLGCAVADCADNRQYTQKDLFEHKGLWHSFAHHGRFSGAGKAACLQQIQASVSEAHQQLKKAHWLMVTFGSAYAYRVKKTGLIAANCHKLPAGEFEKILLSKEAIVREWNELIEKLKNFNPNLNIIFTVSPVRYVRDGVIENNRSKGILLDSVHTLVEQHANCFYFAAYELVIDQLRDYRFYKEDLVHPNHLAVNYVWEKFVDSYCNESTKNFLKEYEPLLRGLQHRPIHPNEEAHQKFRLELTEKIKALDEKYL